MAKIVPVVQLAAHIKSSTFYGRTIVRSYNQMFWAWWLTTISYIMGLRWSSAINLIPSLLCYNLLWTLSLAYCHPGLIRIIVNNNLVNNDKTQVPPLRPWSHKYNVVLNGIGVGTQESMKILGVTLTEESIIFFSDHIWGNSRRNTPNL